MISLSPLKTPQLQSRQAEQGHPTQRSITSFKHSTHLAMLTDLLKPEDCAACRLCCHFHRESAWETPAIEPELVSAYRRLEPPPPLQLRPDASVTFKLNFEQLAADESAACPMLDFRRGCRLPRKERPTECRLWPLRLMRCTEADGGERVVLGCYRNCPGVQRCGLDTMRSFAEEKLKALLLAHAQRLPQMIRPYDRHYEILAEWPELQRLQAPDQNA